MLQGVQGLIGHSGDHAASPQPHGTSGAELPAGGSNSGGFSEEERGRIEEADRTSGGNRWPRQETLALIRIRSDMDVAFRDSSAKGPLWDEVSRKLAELGYHRSAKKCKEKFENVFKYHKRTKDGRTSKADGKTYRFFEQLEALEANPAAASHPTPPLQTVQAMPSNNTTAPHLSFSQQPPLTVPSVVIPFNITGSRQNNVSPISVAAPAVVMPSMNHVGGFPFSHPNMSASTNSTSSSTSSDDEPPQLRKKRKRKWKDFFGRLMKEVIDKQEELQMKFLDRIEKRERERMAREEAWRMGEMAKLNREHDLLVRERSVAAAKDAAVFTFLQKITETNPNVVPQVLQQQQQKQPPPPQKPQNLQLPAAPTLPPEHQVQLPALPPAPVVKNLDNGGGEKANMLAPSPSRWPKAEVNALIKLRTTLDMKYQDSGPKGPLWEEISASMMKLGYNRNAKRCKEKWENINKYYKKVKESSKKRPEDSKTCPYFHQLDAIYREKANNSSSNNPRLPETAQMAPIMAEPEQQWPHPAVLVQQQSTTQERETLDQNNEDDYDDEDEEEEDEGGEYEIVPNTNASSMDAVRVTET